MVPFTLLHHRHPPHRQIRIGHIFIQRKHGTINMLVAQAFQILIDATWGEGHDPIATHLVEFWYQVAYFYHHNI